MVQAAIKCRVVGARAGLPSQSDPRAGWIPELEIVQNVSLALSVIYNDETAMLPCVKDGEHRLYYLSW
jgi:hypothetical protein